MLFALQTDKITDQKQPFLDILSKLMIVLINDKQTRKAFIEAKIKKIVYLEILQGN